jgi:four helix bundle protein
MRNPNDLRVTAESEDLAIAVYEATRDSPRTEMFGLTSQLRRAAVSVGSNIVEGCGRQSDSAFLPFLHNALGSLNELQFQMRIARRLKYGAAVEIRRVEARATAVGKQIASLISNLKSVSDRRS